MHRFLVYPKFKYPKLAMLFISYLVAYMLLVERDFPFLKGTLGYLGYLGIFIAGILYSYGFTAGTATTLIYLMASSLNPYLACIIGGIGSLFGDIVIFEFIRTGFADELKKLTHEHLFRGIRLPISLKKAIIPLIAGLFIASPLPDEIGVSMLAASSIKVKYFAAISFLLNTAGIYAILMIGR